MAGNPESFDLDKTVTGVRRIMWALAVIGTGAFTLRGANWAASFLTGALIAILGFHITHRFVMAIGEGGTVKPATWKNVLLGLRYLIVAAVVYVMMRLFGLNILAALFGLLIPAAAVLLQILYELIHGT